MKLLKKTSCVVEGFENPTISGKQIFLQNQKNNRFHVTLKPTKIHEDSVKNNRLLHNKNPISPRISRFLHNKNKNHKSTEKIIKL
jgi:hypothetical protein